MEFAWDEAKRRANYRKHGLDFRDAEKVFQGITLTAEPAGLQGKTLDFLGPAGRYGGGARPYRMEGSDPNNFQASGQREGTKGI